MSDVRALQQARYKKYLIQNVYKEKYKILFEDDPLIRNATRIVRKLKKTWFKENYNMINENSLLIFKNNSNPKSGLYNFRVNGICLNMEDINDIDEIFKNNDIRKKQYIHQLAQVNIDETIGYNSLQNWELEKALCYDDKDFIKLDLYLNYINKNLTDLVKMFDIELIINIKNEIMKHILEYYSSHEADINDFDIFEEYCADIYNTLTTSSVNNINKYLNYLLLINNISKVKDYLMTSNYNYNWLLNIINSYTNFDNFNSHYLKKINNAIIDNTHKYLHNINKKDKLIECQCCFNEYNKSDLIIDNDFIYCHKCSEIFCNNVSNNVELNTYNNENNYNSESDYNNESYYNSESDYSSDSENNNYYNEYNLSESISSNNSNIE